MSSLSVAEVTKLKKLIKLAQELLEAAEPAAKGLNNGKKSQTGKRVRRSGKELVAFRKMLKAERKKGIPVPEIAERHGVSTAYVYQL